MDVLGLGIFAPLLKCNQNFLIKEALKYTIQFKSFGVLFLLVHERGHDGISDVTCLLEKRSSVFFHKLVLTL